MTGPPEGVTAPSVLAALRCSLCACPLISAARSLRCPQGHTFDVAKQGYVNLLHAKVRAGTADTAEMVAARAAFLGAGHYRPLTTAVARAGAAAAAPDGLVVDAGAGTGHYLSAVLDALPDRIGLAVDVSAHALRRAAKAHPRAAAAVWNLWEPLPLADGCAALVLNVFAPRNGAEYRRILRADGALVVVTPNADHLAELRQVTAMLDVDPDKELRVGRSLTEHFTLVTREDCRFVMTLTEDECRALAGMGPSAHHAGDSPGFPEGPLSVTASCTVAVYRPRVGT